MKSHELAFNKVNFLNLKKERDMLKITLDYFTEENKQLKNELNDMKITAKKNKDMLKEYITQITNKDKLFEKMVSTIEQLKSRLKAMEQMKKEKEKIEKGTNNNINYYLSNDYLNINNNNTYNHSTTTNSNNLTTNNIIGTTGGENCSFGFNILNSNNINKVKNYNTVNNELNSKVNKSMHNINVDNKGFNILRNNKKNNKDINNNINNIINKTKNNIDNNNILIENKEDKKSDVVDTININNIKYFYEKQKNIMEEIIGIKDDIQFLMENKTKSKIKDKLNQSLVSSNSLNSSFCSENKDENNKESAFNNSFVSENNGQQSLDNSYISQNISNLSVSYCGPDQNILRHLNYALNTSSANNPDMVPGYVEGYPTTKNSKKRKKFNLNERYAIDENVSTFMIKTNIKKDMLFLIDGQENVWEIVRRGDLSAEQIKKYDKESEKESYNKIKSVVNLLEDKNNNGDNNLMNLITGKNKDGINNYLYTKDVINKDIANNFLNNNLIDIEIKEPTDIIFK